MRWINPVFEILLIVALLLYLTIFPGYTQPGPTNLTLITDPGSASNYNLILITLDTVRSDHLGCYGYKSAHTPALDTLASTGVVFENAVTTAPITLPAHTTMLTGLYPPNHGIRDNGLYSLDSRFETLAEVLKANEVSTAAFIASIVLDAAFG